MVLAHELLVTIGDREQAGSKAATTSTASACAIETSARAQPPCNLVRAVTMAYWLSAPRCRRRSSWSPQRQKLGQVMSHQIADPLDRQIGRAIGLRIPGVLSLARKNRRDVVAPRVLDGSEDPRLVVHEDVVLGRITSLDVIERLCAKRSSLTINTTSTWRRRTACKSASRPGRRSRAPLIPWSTKSVTFQPRAHLTRPTNSDCGMVSPSVFRLMTASTFGGCRPHFPGWSRSRSTAATKSFTLIGLL